MKVPAAFVSFVLALYGCGGGGGGGGSSFPRLPALMPAQGKNAPIVFRRDGVHVGADVMPARNALSPAGTHDGVAVSSGRVRDGESAKRVTEYLYQFTFGMEGQVHDRELRIPAPAVTIQVRETTDYDRYIGHIVRVVQHINNVLPYDKRLSISSVRAPHPTYPELENIPEGESVSVDTDYVPAGHIYVGIDPQSKWPIPEQPGDRVAGIMDIVNRGYGYTVWIDSEVTQNNTGYVRKVLAHELFHVLGFLNHIELKDFESVMNVRVPGYGGNLTYLLFQIDKDGLHAMNTRFQGGGSGDIEYIVFDPNDLGPWTDVSFHLRGDIDDLSFGASSRNGLIQPWAHGPSPATNLSGMGSASWTGRLLGFTSESQSLAGAADLTINLATLTGQIDFTGLEHWGVNATPGTVGSGTRWNDGDLRYGVIVRGNSFVQTGGDAGEVTGAFFGPNHAGMGGVVERADMSAGFAGVR